MRVIDADAHVTEPPDLFINYLEPKYRENGPKIVRDYRGAPWMPYRIEAERMGLSSDYETSPQRHGKAEEDTEPVLTARGIDPYDRVADMDAEGIAIAMLYPSLGLYLGYLDDPEVAAASSRAYNNWLVDYCSASPSRLLGMGSVPLQDVPEAVKEMRRAVEKLDMKGVFIRPNPYRGRRLDDPVYDPFWAAAQDLDVPIGIHEGTTSLMPTAAGERYRDDPYRLHVVSHVVEQMLACMDILLGGVLERFPRLKIMFLEAGGSWICGWLDRLDHQSDSFGGGGPGGRLTLKPSEYFQRQCWISFDPDECHLEPTVARLGADRLIWASDYPHFDGTFPGAVQSIKNNVSGLPEADQRKILGENSAQIHGLG